MQAYYALLSAAIVLAVHVQQARPSAHTAAPFTCKTSTGDTLSLTPHNLAPLTEHKDPKVLGECIETLPADMAAGLSVAFFTALIDADVAYRITNLPVLVQFANVYSAPAKPHPLYDKFISQLILNPSIMQDILRTLAQRDPIHQERAAFLFTAATLPEMESSIFPAVNANLMARLSPAAIQAIRAYQINHFPPAAFKAITADQLSAFQPSTFATMHILQKAMIPVASYADMTAEQAECFPHEEPNADALTRGLGDIRMALLKRFKEGITSDPSTPSADRGDRAAPAKGPPPGETPDLGMLQPYESILKRFDSNCFLALSFRNSIRSRKCLAILQAKCPSYFRAHAGVQFRHVRSTLAASMAVTLLLLVGVF